MTDDPLLALFRCEHWACTLAEKHCLRRQTEMAPGGRNQKAKTFRPVYAHCASGECAQGNAIAKRHPGFKAEKADPKKAPRLDIVQAVEERTMAKPEKVKRGQPKPCCGSRGTRHMAGCKGTAEASAAVPKERLAKIVAAAKAKGARPVAPAEEPVGVSERVERMSLDELLVWKGLIEGSLAARERVLEEQLAEVRKAIRASKGAVSEAA